MGILEIVLLAAGAIIFVMSFCIPVKQEKLKEEAKKLAAQEVKELVSGELEKVRGTLSALSEEEMQEQIKRSERSMERISNEKIMAVGEYSDTVLNEIHKNHEEVVFLYDMLKNKKESLSASYDKTDQNLQNLLQQVKDSEITVREGLETISDKQKEIEVLQTKTAAHIAASQKAIEAQQQKAASHIAAVQKELEAQQEEVAVRIAEAQQEIEALQTKATSHIAAQQKELEAQHGEAVQRIETAQKELEAQQGEAVLRIEAAQKELKAQQGEAILRIEAAQKELEIRAQKEEEKEASFRPFTPEKVEVIPKKRVVRKTVKEQPKPEEEEDRAARRQFERIGEENRVPERRSGMIEDANREVNRYPERIEDTNRAVNRYPEMLENEDRIVSRRLERMEEEDRAVKRQLESAESFGRENADVMLLLSDSMEKKALNSNERILQLHRAGKSNMAIARELGLGLGEVKLVIDLYKGLW